MEMRFSCYIMYLPSSLQSAFVNFVKLLTPLWNDDDAGAGKSACEERR